MLDDHRPIPGLALLLVLATTSFGPRAAAGQPPITVDPVPTATIADVRIREGDDGPVSMIFPVRLSSAPGAQASVDFATSDGSASAADEDYTPVSGRLTFASTDTVRHIAVTVHGDRSIEGNEWFRVRLSNPVGFTLADSEAVGIILNDERPGFVRRLLAAEDYADGTLPTAWGDFNGDGQPDLPLFEGRKETRFAEMPGFRHLLAQGNYHGAAACDYDRDGDVDLVILGYTLGERLTANLLLRNNGNGTFANVAPQLGMAVSGYGETAVWADFDGDGWPDLFAPFYTDLHPYQSFLYMNNRDGTFTDRAAEAGVSTPGVPWRFHPEGAHAADWNDDGHLDLYCASHLFINDGHGRFTDVREAVGLPAVFDEGSSFVDYDNDGDLDLYLRCYETPRLFRNDGGRFTEVTASAGISGVPWFWGDSWADADNDGDMDLVQHGGNARLLLNQGDGTFALDPDFSRITSTQELSAWADADGDGDLDVVIGPMGKELYLNQIQGRPGFPGSWLRVRVVDENGHETVHGATVRLRELGDGPVNVQTRVVDGGSGYLSQNEYTVQFGGMRSGRYALEIVFPSPAGQRIVVDSLVNPVLGSIVAGQFPQGRITVYRDGRVESPPLQNPVAHRAAARPGWPRHLGQPTPSPATHGMRLPMALEGTAEIRLTIHDPGGRAVRTIDAGVRGPGPFGLDWDLLDDRGRPAANGVYFGRLHVDGIPTDTRRMLVLR